MLMYVFILKILIVDMPVCYCENKDGKTPNNGIMCDYIGGAFNRDGYCSTQETCNGATEDDSSTKWVCNYRKGDLCEVI